MTKPIVYFYGCLKGIDERHTEAGHYMEASDGSDAWRLVNPFGSFPDGTLCPDERKGQPQGLAILHQKDDWTAIGFWDRTGDSRPGSNSNFLVQGTYTFEEMCAMAQEAYPALWKRIGAVRQ